MPNGEYTIKNPLVGKFTLEHVPCDLCGASEYKLRYRKPDTWLRNCHYEYSVVECTQCNLVYVNPRPTVQSMASFYPGDYHAGRDDQNSQERYARQLRYLKLDAGDSVLDVGCARGDFLNFIHQTVSNIDLFGVDAYCEGVTNKHIKFHKCLLTEAPFDASQFNHITAWAVIEHVHNPKDYFVAVKRFLKPNGKFVFLVTNSESRYGRKAYSEDVPRHTYHFSEDTLQHYARDCGFSKCEFDFCDDIYDGRGFGTWQYSLKQLAGWTWEKELLGKVSVAQKFVGLAGNLVDRLLFKSHWEARTRQSGIVVATFHA